MRPVFRLAIRPIVLWIPGILLRLPSTGLSPFVASLSRELQNVRIGVAQVQTPHPCILTVQVRFVLCRFQSPLLTASRLLSLPGVTKMFQFSPLLFTVARELTSMRHWVSPGSKAACAYPGLIAACHDLRQLPSQAIHQIAWELAIFISDLWSPSSE